MGRKPRRSREVGGEIQELGEDGGSKTSDGVPTRSALESLAAVVGVDSLEGVSKDRGVLVEQGVDETKGFLALGETVVVEEGDDTSPDGGGTRSSSDLAVLSVDNDLDVLADTGDIGVGTSVTVVEGSRGKGDSTVQVGVDGALLVRGHPLVTRESTRAEVGSDLSVGVRVEVGGSHKRDPRR